MTTQARNFHGLTMNLGRSGITLGTTSTYTTTAATVGCINGKLVTALGVQTNVATPTTDCVTGAAFRQVAPDRGTVIVFGQTAAGAIQMCQGTIERLTGGSGNTAGTFVSPPQFPELPQNFMPLGYCTVRLGPSASPFTAGTTSWTATGVTASAVQGVTTLSDRPQVS